MVKRCREKEGSVREGGADRHPCMRTAHNREGGASVEHPEEGRAGSVLQDHENGPSGPGGNISVGHRPPVPKRPGQSEEHSSLRPLPVPWKREKQQQQNSLPFSSLEYKPVHTSIFITVQTTLFYLRSQCSIDRGLSLRLFVVRPPPKFPTITPSALGDIVLNLSLPRSPAALPSHSPPGAGPRVGKRGDGREGREGRQDRETKGPA